ncbi:MAG: ABC-2 family transporter protein [Firmicutes bacterium]|nr:ABC-2 family transporter protein [Bacillota bacterium]
MKKYAHIFTTSLKQETKTLRNTIIQAFNFVVIIYIFIQMWSYIYGNADGQVISGFSLSMMIWYLIITETIMYSVNGRGMVRDMGRDVRSGKIAYMITRPYNYFSYQLTTHFAGSLFRGMLIFVAGLVIGFAVLGYVPNFSAYGLLLGFLSLLIGIFLLCLIMTLVGMLAFWVENAQPYYWLVSKMFLMLVLFFPPEIFGGWIQDVIVWSPFNAAMAAPARLFVNFSWELFYQTMLIQLVYLVLFIGLGIFMFKRGTRKVNVYGG